MTREDVVTGCQGQFSIKKAWGKECRWSFLWKQGSSLWWVTCLGFPQMLSTQQSLRALEYRGSGNEAQKLWLAHPHLTCCEIPDPGYSLWSPFPHLSTGVGVCLGTVRVTYIYDSVLMWFFTDRRGTESETEKSDEKEGTLLELLPSVLCLGWWTRRWIKHTPILEALVI